MRTKRADLEADREALSERIVRLRKHRDNLAVMMGHADGALEILTGLHDDIRHVLDHLAQWPEGKEPLADTPNVPAEISF